MIRKLLAAASAAAAALFAQPASAQAPGCPTISFGQVWTAAQWNTCLASKQNALGYTPVNKAGDTMTGKLQLAPSATGGAGFNIAQGNVPTSPINGDMWLSSSGLFFRQSGVTIGPLIGGAGSFAATAPITMTTPSGVVTYALAIDSNFAVSGGNLALAPIASGSLIANGGAGSAEPTETTPSAWLSRWCSGTAGAFPTATGASTWGCGTTGTSGHTVPYLDGANTFSGNNTFSAALTWSGTLTPTALVADVNNYNPSGLTTALTLRLDGGVVDRSITGLSGGADGRIIQIVNVGATNNLTLVNQSASSTAANRFLLAANTTLQTNDSITLRYDGTSGFWRPFDRSVVTVATAAGGDLSGAYPNPTVAKINGVTLGSTTATAGNLLIGSGTTWVSTALSGDVTVNSGGTTAIGSAKVTNAMLAGSIDLSTKVTGNLPITSLCSGSGASNTTFLRGDCTWATPSGSGFVAGPGGGSTDTAIARWSGASGTVLINSGVLIDNSNNITGIVTIASGANTITSTSATALAVGRLGATTPAFQVDASTATSITGIKVKSAAAGGGVALSAIGETNVALTIDAAGSGTITFGGTSTGAITLTRAATLSAALTYGGVTLSNAVTGTGNMVLSASPTFTGTVTTAALSSTTGAFSSTVTSTAHTITSASASALAVGLNGATNPALVVDASTASSATGLKIKSAAAAAGVALSVVTSGTNENLTIDAAGSGTITLGGTSTGAITLTRAATLSAALTYGGVTLSNAVTGTGNMVLATSPTLTTPTLGVATATTINKVTITAPATSATLTVQDGKTFTVTGTGNYNGGGTGTFTLSGNNLSLITSADSAFTIPATGTAALINVAQAITALKTFTNSTIKILGSSTGGTTLTSANTGASDFTLTLPAVNATALTNGSTPFKALPGAATNVSVGSYTMLGLGGSCAFTPAYSTRVMFVIQGFAYNSGANNTNIFQLYSGTGTAPAVNAALTGTATADIYQETTSATGSATVAFHQMAYRTGLVVGTAYWFDFAAQVTAGTATYTTTCIAWEF